MWYASLNAMRVAYRHKDIENIQRRAEVRCICVHHTVSTEAVCILVHTLPIDLLIEKRPQKEVTIKNAVLN